MDPLVFSYSFHDIRVIILKLDGVTCSQEILIYFTQNWTQIAQRWASKCKRSPLFKTKYCYRLLAMNWDRSACNIIFECAKSIVGKVFVIKLWPKMLPVNQTGGFIDYVISLNYELSCMQINIKNMFEKLKLASWTCVIKLAWTNLGLKQVAKYLHEKEQNYG